MTARLTPDGGSLLVEKFTTESEIALISIASGTERVVAHGAHPFLSGDGKRIVFTSRGALYETPLEGGPLTKLVDLPGLMYDGIADGDGMHLELRRNGVAEWWRLGADGKLVPEATRGLVMTSPHGSIRVLRAFDHGYHYRWADHDVVGESQMISWLDDRRFAYAAGGTFHIIDAGTGAETGTVPGPDWGELAILAPDAVHWFDLEPLGHATRHVINNFAQRPRAW